MPFSSTSEYFTLQKVIQRLNFATVRERKMNFGEEREQKK
jgi:hypothetical protein